MCFGLCSYFFLGSGSFVGEEQCRGEPIEDDVRLRESEFLVWERSVRIEYGLEWWSFSKRSKRVVLKFGIPHWIHSHEVLLLCSVSYMVSRMFSHCVWNHILHVSQQMALCLNVTALLQTPHGNLGGLGPGFVWTSLESSIRFIKSSVAGDRSFI